MKISGHACQTLLWCNVGDPAPHPFGLTADLAHGVETSKVAKH
jgi:hypothetical protein